MISPMAYVGAMTFLFFLLLSFSVAVYASQCQLIDAKSHACDQPSLKHFFHGEDCAESARQAFKSVLSAVCYHHQGRVTGSYKKIISSKDKKYWTMGCQSAYAKNTSFLCTFELTQ